MADIGAGTYLRGRPLTFVKAARNHFSTPVHLLLGLVLGLVLAGTPRTHAATVWTGPVITYSQPSPNPTLAANQDRLTADVWLTRATSKGLFNAFYETNATALSPANTEWAFGSLTNYASLGYTNWLAWLNGASPVTLVGQPVVVHLISDDIYLSLNFTFWAAGGSGGFTYQRSTPAVINAPAFNLSGVALQGGLFSFSYASDAGATYVIQASTNLVDWVPLSTNVASGGTARFTNAVNAAGARFYRAGRMPAP